MYRKHLLLVLTVLILAVIQLSFTPELFGDVIINPVFAFSFAFLIVNKKEEALFSGFVGGLSLDLLGNGLFGVSAFLFVLFLILSGLVKRYVLNNFLSHILLFISFQMVYLIVLNYPVTIGFAPAAWGAVISLVVSYLISLMHKNVLHERKFI